jgi:hypothetical protein
MRCHPGRDGFLTVNRIAKDAPDLHKRRWPSRIIHTFLGTPGFFWSDYADWEIRRWERVEFGCAGSCRLHRRSVLTDSPVDPRAARRAADRDRTGVAAGRPERAAGSQRLDPTVNRRVRRLLGPASPGWNHHHFSRQSRSCKWGKGPVGQNATDGTASKLASSISSVPVVPSVVRASPLFVRLYDQTFDKKRIIYDNGIGQYALGSSSTSAWG